MEYAHKDKEYLSVTETSTDYLCKPHFNDNPKLSVFHFVFQNNCKVCIPKNQKFQVRDCIVIEVSDLSNLSSLECSVFFSTNGSFICFSLKTEIIGVRRLFGFFFFYIPPFFKVDKL